MVQPDVLLTLMVWKICNAKLLQKIWLDKITIYIRLDWQTVFNFKPELVFVHVPPTWNYPITLKFPGLIINSRFPEVDRRTLSSILAPSRHRQHLSQYSIWSTGHHFRPSLRNERMTAAPGAWIVPRSLPGIPGHVSRRRRRDNNLEPETWTAPPAHQQPILGLQ